MTTSTPTAVPDRPAGDRTWFDEDGQESATVCYAFSAPAEGSSEPMSVSLAPSYLAKTIKLFSIVSGLEARRRQLDYTAAAQDPNVWFVCEFNVFMQRAFLKHYVRYGGTVDLYGRDSDELSRLIVAYRNQTEKDLECPARIR